MTQTKVRTRVVRFILTASRRMPDTEARLLARKFIREQRDECLEVEITAKYPTRDPGYGGGFPNGSPDHRLNFSDYCFKATVRAKGEQT